jgi:hypothetical protein
MNVALLRQRTESGLSAPELDLNRLHVSGLEYRGNPPLAQEYSEMIHRAPERNLIYYIGCILQFAEEISND